MKTLLQKFNGLVKVISLSMILTVFAAASFASDNKANVSDSGSNKYSIVKSEVSTISGKSQTNYENELNAITSRISEAVKFRATPLIYDSIVNEMDSELNTITEEVAKSVKFQPTIVL